MIFLSVKCDNLYMFKNLNLDFTYERKINHSLTQHDTLFEGSNIKVRKHLILMGGNASGKTTFGKLLCFISNYIYRGYINKKDFSFSDIRYNQRKNSYFEVEFYSNGYAYKLYTEFNQDRVLLEKLTVQKIYKSFNIATLRKKLNEKEADIQHKNVEIDMIEDKDIILSPIFSNTIEKNRLDIVNDIKKRTGFLYRMSSLQNTSNSIARETDILTLNKILPLIDNSVAGVTVMKADDKKTQSYQINFKNGTHLLVPDGDLQKCNDRLSHGTFEAIDFIVVMSLLKNIDAIAYIDERLAHIHSELEAYLTRQLFLAKSVNSQYFITTHNLELFHLNVPMNAFLFFKRNDDGYNEVVYPTSFLNKNDRNLSSYYVNDYFGVMPKYSVLDDLFEKILFTNEGQA